MRHADAARILAIFLTNDEDHFAETSKDSKIKATGFVRPHRADNQRVTF